jgi:hypothetical protein
VSEDSPDKMAIFSKESRARACLRASKRGNFVGNQRFLKRYVGRKTKGTTIKNKHFQLSGQFVNTYNIISSVVNICHSRCFGIRGGHGKSAFKLAVKLSIELGYVFLSLRL